MSQVKHGRFQLFSIAVPAVPIPAFLAVPAIPIPAALAIPVVPAVLIQAFLAVLAILAVICSSRTAKTK